MKMSKLAVAAGLQALALTGCYVVPIGPDGNYAVYPLPPYPAPVGSSVPAQPLPGAPAAPRILNARLYPDNELASSVGPVSGTVTNMMSGKGRFQIQYQGVVLTGAATRVDGDARKGIASAWGPSGSFMSCEYQMNSPLQGAGNCQFSNGAKYKVHVGN